MRTLGRPSRAPGQRGPATRAAVACDDERGSLTLMLAVLFVSLLAIAGIVVDGGAKLDAAQNAVAAAQEAARAGAGMVNRTKAYSAGSFTVQRDQALAAARQYLGTAGYRDFTIAAVGADSIQVRVTVTEPTKFLSLIGIDSMTATGSATASLVAGVTGPGT
jgi:Flp pilus assembly protein TadG